MQQFPNKVFVVSVEDAPLGLLSGLYTSLTAWRHHPHRHRTTLNYRTQNPYLRSLRADRRVSSPPYLASFMGAMSHDFRRWLFEMADSFAQHDILLKATSYNRFLIPQDPELKPLHLDFIDVSSMQKFSLCPRGNGAGSYRLQESLALGRAPVIISDERHFFSHWDQVLAEAERYLGQ